MTNLKMPLLIVAGVMALILLAWLPGNQTPVQQKPYVDLQLRYDRTDARLQQLADDLRYRMSTHHSYRLLSEDTQVRDGYLVHSVEVQLLAAERLILRATVDDQDIEVDGPPAAASTLSAQLFRLMNNELDRLPASENGH